MSILSRVQTNPDILTDNSTYVTDLVERVKNYITKFCNLDRFPESDSQGYHLSGTSASTDISGISSNSFYVSINKSSFIQVSIDLSVCTSGNAIASELQTKIRNAYDYNGFDEVTVTFDSDNSQYTITSGRFGEYSNVDFKFEETGKHVCQNLKLSKHYGGKSYFGTFQNDALIDAAVKLVESEYRKLGLEGVSNVSYSGALSASFHNIEPTIENILLANRRL